MLLSSRRKDVPFSPYINTGTLFDLYTGKYRAASTGGMVLDGGITHTLGISGRAQTYKSGLGGSLMARALQIHPQAEAYVYETEGTIPGPERYDDFIHDTTVSDRILFHNNTVGSLTDFYDEFCKIIDDKIKNKKDYMVESPFLNPMTRKPYKVWIPTLVLVDSFSRARSDSGDKKFDDNSIDDSSMNTFWLHEGNVKTRIMNDLPLRAAKAGIYVILTAHVGNKQDMDPYNRSPKQLQYMKNSDKMKNVGSNFEFLASILLQTTKSTVLQDKNKNCEYPHKHSSNVEVNLIDTMLVRCKNNAAGYPFGFVMSQYQGLLDSVTNFHFLRQCKNYGFDVKGNNQGFTPALSTSDTILTKNNLRKITEEDHSVCRGLQILAEMCFIQNLWSSWNMPEYFKTSPQAVAEVLAKSEKWSTQRILNSTGSWSTSKQDRELLTTLDILRIVDQERNNVKIVDMKPKT